MKVILKKIWKNIQFIQKTKLEVKTNEAKKLFFCMFNINVQHLLSILLGFLIGSLCRSDLLKEDRVYCRKKIWVAFFEQHSLWPLWLKTEQFFIFLFPSI